VLDDADPGKADRDNDHIGTARAEPNLNLGIKTPHHAIGISQEDSQLAG
jgi:hypothetical protein